MSAREDRLRRDRALRNRARAVLDEQLGRVKEDLGARGIGARAAHTVADEARQAADRGAHLARESKGAIAGIAFALLAWKFREPLLRQIKDLYGRSGKDNGPQDCQDGDSDSE